MTLVILLSIHLYTNYAAVRAVRMRSFNRQRTNIVVSHLRDTGKVLTPTEVSRSERIFERDGILKWRQTKSLGYGVIGVELGTLLQRVGGMNRGTGSFTEMEIDFVQWLKVFEKCSHLLWYDPQTRTTDIVLKRGATPYDQLKAWSHCLLMAKAMDEVSRRETVGDILTLLRESLQGAESLFDISVLEASGWDLQTAALETKPGTRIDVVSHSAREVNELIEL